MTKTYCSVCLHGFLTEVVDFGKVPLANGFRCPQRLEPMRLAECNACGHAQLMDFIAGEELFADYAYSAGTNDMQRAMFEELVAAVDRRVGLLPVDVVVDIGSNDDALLRAFDKHDVCSIGVDPNGGDYAWWSHTVADAVKEGYGEARVITLTNTLAHLDDLHAAVGAMASLLAQDGTIVIQVPWLRDLVLNNSWDTIYHEHKHYFSVAALRRLFQEHWLDVQHVDYLPQVHGGTIRVWVGGVSTPPDASVHYAEALEADVQIARFNGQIAAHRHALRDLLGSDEVWAFGASAKGVMLMHGLQFDISRIYDDAFAKVGGTLPGSDLTIRDAASIAPPWPDTILLTAWNYADRLVPRLRKAGFVGRIVVPFPMPHEV